MGCTELRDFTFFLSLFHFVNVLAGGLCLVMKNIGRCGFYSRS